MRADKMLGQEMACAVAQLCGNQALSAVLSDCILIDLRFEHRSENDVFTRKARHDLRQSSPLATLPDNRYLVRGKSRT